MSWTHKARKVHPSDSASDTGWGRVRPTRWPQRVLIALVQGYRLVLKPWLGQACRFEPTCSQYALTALQRHGAVVGTALTTGRLMRCHPWCAGGCDDVPPSAPRWLSRLGLGEPAPASGTTSPDTHPSREPYPQKTHP